MNYRRRAGPIELVNAILKAPVDLLYNGGIGTYVKAQSESHGRSATAPTRAARQRAGAEVQVVAEGGNLGCTQLGRIEYAHAGGRIIPMRSTTRPASTLDHEVNIKILLGSQSPRAS